MALKISPYFASSNSSFSPEAVRQIFDTPLTTYQVFFQKTCVDIIIKTGIRAEDLQNVYSWNIEFVPCPYGSILERGKDNPTGIDQASNSTHRVPCSRLSPLPWKQGALLVLTLGASPLEQSPCVSNCSFSVINIYLNNTPDPFDPAREIGIATGKLTQGRLKFILDLSTRENRVFTKHPLGKLNNFLNNLLMRYILIFGVNGMRNALTVLNMLLPEPF